MTGFAASAPVFSEIGKSPIPCAGKDGKCAAVPWRDLDRETVRRSLPSWRARFADANVALLTGERFGLTVADIDTPKDAALADALGRFGDTPAIGETPRGGHHLFYRSSGEATRVKLDGLPIDIRGNGGLIVAPPSTRPGGGIYRWLRGGVEDLKRLPPMKPGSLPSRVCRNRTTPVPGQVVRNHTTSLIGEGSRNDTLFRHAMRHARECETAGELLARLEILNESQCAPPLDQSEVESIAASAWRYESAGKNWVGGVARVQVSHEELDRLEDDAVLLLLKLRRAHPEKNDQFSLSPRGMAPHLGWTEPRIRKARSALIDAGLLCLIHGGGAGAHDPAQFRFGSRSLSEAGEE